MENSNEEKPQSKLPKIKSFKTVRKNFAKIGINPKLVSQSYPFNGKILMCFLTICPALVLVCVYILTVAKTFSEYTQSIYIASALILTIFVLMVLILQVKKLFKFIDDCDSILNTTLFYFNTKSIYHEVNQFEEKLNKIFFLVMMKLTPICVFVPWITYNIFIYLATGLGNSTFELAFPMWFPFDWKNPCGFLIAIAFQYAMLSFILTIDACVLAFAIGTYLYAILMSRTVKGCLCNFKWNYQTKTDQSNLLEQLTEFLEYHSKAKQMTTNFSDIVQPLAAILFTWSLITICGALLMIQIQLISHDANLVVMLVTIIEIIYAFGALFVICELGQRVSFAFVECKEIFDQLEWYLFATEIQRMLPMILNFMQRPFEVTCFGSKAIDRETFKSIIKTAFSYFTVLRELYN